MKPIFVCEKCRFAFNSNVEPPHLFPHKSALQPCLGTLQPAFLAENLLKEIQARIKNCKYGATQELQNLADTILEWIEGK